MSEQAKQISAKALTGAAVSELRANGWDTNVLRPVAGMTANGLLRKDEWKRFDDAIIPLARERLMVVGDLLDRGLVHPVPHIGVMQVEWERVSDMDPAHESMSGLSRAQYDAVDFQLDAVPLPLTLHDFPIDIRRLEASQTLGQSLDTTQGEVAAIKVAERLEDTLLNGSDLSLGGNSIYGYTNFPHRLTGDLSGDWTDTGTVSGEDILADVLAMIGALEAINFFGPFVMYVSTGYANRLRDDFKAGSDKSLRERLLEIDALQDIRAPGRLAANNVVMVQMTRNVVDMAVAQETQTVQWPEMAGFIQWFRVWAAMVPRFKRDHNDRTGIAHYTPA